ETGNGDLRVARDDANQQYLSLTGLAVRQDLHDTKITEQLAQLKRSIFGDPSIVLHRRELVSQKGGFSRLKDSEVRAKFSSQVADLLRGLPATVFTVTVDKRAFLEEQVRRPFGAYHYALVCLLEWFVLWLDQRGAYGDVEGEMRGPKDDAQLRRTLRFFYEGIGTDLRKEVIQSRLTTSALRLKSKKANIAGLQIADLLAYPALRAHKSHRLGVGKSKDEGAVLAEILEISKYYRNVSDGEVEGWGRKWLP